MKKIDKHTINNSSDKIDMFWNFCAIFCAIILIVEGKNEEYRGHKIYKIKFTSQDHQNKLHELKKDTINFLITPSIKHGVLGKALVPQSEAEWFEGKLNELRIEKEVAVTDVYLYFSTLDKTLVKTFQFNPERVFDFDGYYRYDEIINHLRLLEQTYSNTTVKISVEEYGNTDQNRPLVYIKITSDSTEMVEKPVIIVEAAGNPREWITVPSALNIVNNLIENENLFLDRAEWIIIPVLNPDGYEYTHTNLRLWTKNYSMKTDLGFICPGVNINRNFDISWGQSDSSSSPCSHIYSGIEPFSEIESQLTRSLILEHNSNIRLYISLQNTGGFISFPWHYEKAASGMFRQHILLGLDMADSMNDDYKVDQGTEVFGDRVSGTSLDFVQENGVLYSLSVGVVNRGEDGVSIPEDEIKDVVEDVWRAVAIAADKLL